MAGATERVKTETDRAGSEERWREKRAAGLRRKSVAEMAADDVPINRQNLLAEDGQETLIVLT